jgi:ABC-2 type transport system permease protein
MRRAVFRGRLGAGLVIPPGWRPQGAEPLVLSLSESTPGAPVIRAQIEAVAEPAAASRPVRLEPRRARAIADLPTGFRYTAPANLVLFLVMNGIVGGLAIIELRSRRIARRLLAMPVATASILTGIAAGAFQSLTAQALFLIALTGLAFGVPWGDPLGVALLSGALVAFGTACSLFAGTFFRTAEQCMSLGPLVGIVLGMLGGCMWPLSVVPPWLREVSAYVPTTWALDAFLALGSLGAGARDVLPTAAALLAGAAVVGAAGLARLRRRLAD